MVSFIRFWNSDLFSWRQCCSVYLHTTLVVFPCVSCSYGDASYERRNDWNKKYELYTFKLQEVLNWK